jgi:ATP-dependent Clp protease ATP-binding subunit ClpC
LLLDEIEKASSDVFDVLLSLLDEGRLTDRYGQTTSFLSCVVIMTSNVGVRRGSSFGFGEALDVDYASEVRKAFRPEFFNRLDYIIPFLPLKYEMVIAIAAKELQDLAGREGILKRSIKLEWTDRVVGELAKIGFHPELGARPLQKALETYIVAPLSRWMLDHPEASHCRLLMDVEAEQLVFVMD